MLIFSLSKESVEIVSKKKDVLPMIKIDKASF